MITHFKQESIIKPKDHHFQLKDSPSGKSSSIKQPKKQTDENFSPRSKDKPQHKGREGRWQIHEQNQYIKFLEENAPLFESQYSRRSKKVFDQLARIFKNSRTAEQCRSHHQKMQKKVGSHELKAIIEYIRSKNERKQKMQVRAKIREEIKVRRNPQKVEYIRDPKNKYEIKIEKRSTCIMTVKFQENIRFISWGG